MELIRITAEGANIIKRYDEAELVAVQHANGYVGIYAEAEDELFQISVGLTKPADGSDPIKTADRMMGR